MLRTFCFFYGLKSNLYKPDSALAAMQLKKLQRLLVHAYDNTDYYRRLFDEHKFEPNRIEAVDDLRRLPILTKSDIKENCDSILARKSSDHKLITHHTSGSTGIPLEIFGDSRSEAYNRALKYRAYVENGLGLRDVVAEVTSPENVNSHKYWLQRLGFFRRHKLSVLDDHTELFAQINRIKPDVLECYPSVLNLIARDCKKENLQFRPKIIFTTAELLLPAWRKNIVRFFDCDVRDMYGSAEFYRLAWECEKHEGYHLDTDAHVIEFLDKENNPVSKGDGHVVVTGLFNYVFPLIRYKVGEIARLKDRMCSCGRSLPLIDSIQGREDDYIKLPSGRTVSPRKINLLDSVKGIKEYVTIQLKKDLIKVEVVRSQDFTEDAVESIKKQIRQGCMGEAVDVNVELVMKIKRKPGKIRTVISLVK
ncbi:MAG: hypothetical protein CEE38_04940 [Planctomycetes bacterium B3_Pla]|nr:MAG: hypothetical protein CEE38_04940 [Planctomycetes bacterium B3_Pla]